MKPADRNAITNGLADVAHVVEDSAYLRAICAGVAVEREIMIQTGLALLQAVRITAKLAPELHVLVTMGERAFGERS